MFILNRIVLVLNGLAILVLLACYAAPFISPELYWPVAFLGLAYPVIVGCHLLFIVYWIAVFKLKFLYSLVAILIGYTYIPSYVQLSAKKTEDKTNSIVLMDFNMKNLGALDEKKYEHPDKLFEIYDKVNPDIICFQEFRNCGTAKVKPMYQKLKKRVNGFYSYNLTLNQSTLQLWGQDMCIISRYPIIDSGVVEHHPESGNYTIFADVKINDDTIRIINTHLQSIRFDEPDYKAVKNIKIPDDSTVSAWTNISRKLKVAFVKRAKQSEIVRDFIQASPYKIIIAGDFNDSPLSYAYRTVRGDLKDAFIESGSGLGRTYVGVMPSFRIDYILYHPSFTAYNYYAKAFEFSDHKMVSCTIRLK